MDHLPQENIPESSLLKLSFQIASVLCALLKLYQLKLPGKPSQIASKYHQIPLQIILCKV